MTVVSGKSILIVMIGPTTTRWRTTLVAVAIILCALSLAAADGQKTSTGIPGGFTATAWPQADHLFRSDPLWLGGDAAYSVDLGHRRVLWLFGDSFIATKPGETRRQSTFVHNSIAIEKGYNPARASLKFYWPTIKGKPSEFAPNEGKVWLWPEDGIRLGDKLLLFFSRIHADHNKNSLGFKGVGWTAFLVGNPDAQPSKWVLNRLATPQNPWGIDVGAAVYRQRGFLYAFGSRPGGDSLVRWPVSEAEIGNLSRPQWWCGKQRGWIAQNRLKRAPAIVIPGGSTELSVQWNRQLDKFVTVESVGFGASNVAILRADRLEGPWSKPSKVYHPPESNRPDAFVYAGKGHPGLKGADLVITYVANSSSDQILARDMSIYYPRFVRLDFAKH